MKKVFSIAALFIFAFVLNASAQLTTKPAEPTAQYELKNVMVSSVKVIEGANTVPVPNNGGTVKFTRRGTTITNVTYTDVAGKTERLVQGSGATSGGQSPSCKCPLPDACFATANKNIGMCICKPCSVSNGGGEEIYSISLLIPAIIRDRTIPARQ